MDCPRCGGDLDRYTLGDRTAVGCASCGYAGVPVERRHYPGAPHGFLSLADTVPAAADAWDDLAAAANATLDVIESEDLGGNATARGRQLRDRLEDLRSRYPEIGNVSGMGLMQGTHMVDADGQPDGERATHLLKACERRGLLLIKCGAWGGQVVRWIPPLIVDAEQIDWAVDRFAEALDEARQQAA